MQTSPYACFALRTFKLWDFTFQWEALVEEGWAQFYNSGETYFDWEKRCMYIYTISRDIIFFCENQYMLFYDSYWSHSQYGISAVIMDLLVNVSSVVSADHYLRFATHFPVCTITDSLSQE